MKKSACSLKQSISVILLVLLSFPVIFTFIGSNGSATKELLPPPSGTSSVIKDNKDKDKKEEKGKDVEKEKDKEKKDGKDVASSSISSTASTTSAKFTTSNFVETVSTHPEWYLSSSQ